MFLPQSYPVALLIMFISMLCWGSWANTQKIDPKWRFELFYWDYVWGLLACGLLLGLTLGRTDPTAPESFFRNLGAADTRNLLYAFVGGVIFNAGNLLLVAAIAMAGLAVAFPIGCGVGLVIGVTLNYIITPQGNSLLLFGGIALVSAAIVFDALAYRRLSRASNQKSKAGSKGIIVSLICGVLIGLFYPLVAKALKGDGHLGPYTVYAVFALGVVVSNFVFNYWLMRHPVAGQPLALADYFRGRWSSHLWGILGGVIWGIGTMSSFVASAVPVVGPAASFAFGQGNTLISALWGVFIWKEFRGGGAAVNRLLALMFLLFALGLVSIALAPIL